MGRVSRKQTTWAPVFAHLAFSSTWITSGRRFARFVATDPAHSLVLARLEQDRCFIPLINTSWRVNGSSRIGTWHRLAGQADGRVACRAAMVQPDVQGRVTGCVGRD